MAQQATKVNNVRMQKPKTPEQLRRKERNEMAARDRLQRLQVDQRLLKQLRGEGWKGSDQYILESYKQQCRIIAEDLRLKRMEDEAEQWIENVLSTPIVGGTITRWLKERITLPPIQLKESISAFLNRENNKKIKQAVVEHLCDLMEKHNLRQAKIDDMAYDAGRQACREGKTIQDNPYFGGDSECYEEWKRGYGYERKSQVGH